MHNPNCDGSYCHGPFEVRILPLGGGGNLHLCQACFNHEMAWRQSENKRGVAYPWNLSTWESLEVYKSEE